MKRKLIMLTCIILLPVIFLVPFPFGNVSQITTVESSNIIYVDGYHAGSEYGSTEYPFNTIQEGIDAASSGDTVKVAGYSNLTYYESLSIDESLTLTRWEERSPSYPIIDGSTGEENYVVRIVASYVTLSHLTIQGYAIGPPHNGILCEGGYLYNVNISSNIITKHDHGIYFDCGCADAIIEDNIIDKVKAGIEFPMGSQGSRIENNTGQGYWPKFEEEWGSGLILQLSSNSYVVNNTFQNFTFGIDLYRDNEFAYIANNRVSKCLSGLDVWDLTDGSVIDNKVQDCSSFGMRITRNYHTDCTNNSIQNCGEGIHTCWSSSINLTRNFLYENERAISLHDANSTYIWENTILSSLNQYFISASNCYDIDIFHNDVLGVYSPPCLEENCTNHYYNNYWSDYDYWDRNGDGLGDRPHLVANDPANYDNYPLIDPWRSIAVVWREVRYDCSVCSNITVSWFSFAESSKSTMFRITLADRTGCCNVTIPRILLDGQFNVTVDGVPVSSILSWNNTHTSIWFKVSVPPFIENSTCDVEVTADIAGRKPLELNDTYIEFGASLQSSPGTYTITIPRTALDGQFKVMVDDVPVPSIISWNKDYTTIYFIYNKEGNHDIKVIADKATSMISTVFPDINYDGIIDIFDVVILATNFGKSLNG